MPRGAARATAATSRRAPRQGCACTVRRAPTARPRAAPGPGSPGRPCSRGENWSRWPTAPAA
eukprot:2500366-Lingulodinium_polyedra.AAC.1